MHINLKLQLWKKCVIYIYIFTSSTIDILNHAPAAGFLLYLEVPEDSLRARLSVVPGRAEVIAALLQNQFAVTDDGSPPAPRPCPPRLRPPYSLAISLFTFHYSLGRRHSASVLSVSVTKSILARDNDWWKIRTCNNSIATKFDILLDYYLGKKGVVDMLIVQFCTPKLYPVP